MSEQSGFQLSGSAPEMYERYLVTTLCIALAEDLVTAAALTPGERILDVACGTGVVSRRAAQAVGPTGAVTGLDVNEGMLSMARSISSPDDASISYEAGSAMAIPFPDETFDVVFCQHGLEFFSDRGQSLREMRRVLKSEGRLGLRVWSAFAHQPFHRAVLAALDRHHWGGQDVPSRTVFTQAFSLWETDELRTLVVDAGFRDIDVSVSTIPFRLGSSSTDILGYLSALPIRSEILEMEETARTAMLDEAVTALNTYVDEDKFVMPAESQVVLAWR